MSLFIRPDSKLSVFDIQIQTEKYGEEIMAWIKLKDGQETTEEEKSGKKPVLLFAIILLVAIGASVI